jgi:ketosteroid isomerase-like protein
MKMHTNLVCAWVLTTALPLAGAAADDPVPAPAVTAAPAATAPDREATHNELRALRDAILGAWEKRDLDAMLSHADEQIVVTWQNGEVSRGPAAVKKFYQSMFEDDGGLIADMKSDLKVDDLAILHDPDTAVAFGSIHDVITFKKSLATSFIGAGDQLDLESRWSATILRKDGAWKIASYHVSANVFSNPVMSLAVKSTRRIAALAGFLAGAVLVVLIIWIRRARHNPTPVS